MPDSISTRTQAEKDSYDNGTVWQNNNQIRNRFYLIWESPNTVHAEQDFLDRIAKVIPNQDILDYGCGDGWNTENYLKFKPKSICGIDISEKGIQEATQKFGDVAKFDVMDAHHMSFSDQSFDVVIGRAILHHLDFETALSEIARVLRPGGVVLFVEPLGSNPFAKLFRLLTPKARTKDESPLVTSQIYYADSLFKQSNHRFFNLFSIPIAMLASLLKLDSNFKPLKWADKVDQSFSKTPLRWWMRAVLLEWKK